MVNYRNDPTANTAIGAIDRELRQKGKTSREAPREEKTRGTDARGGAGSPEELHRDLPAPAGRSPEPAAEMNPPDSFQPGGVAGFAKTSAAVFGRKT